MSIKDRIGRLERGRPSCPECHLEPERGYVVYPDEDPPEREYCPGCGRLLGFVIEVVYEGEGGGGIGYGTL
jgi:hypothetical protein